MIYKNELLYLFIDSISNFMLYLIQCGGNRLGLMTHKPCLQAMSSDALTFAASNEDYQQSITKKRKRHVLPCPECNSTETKARHKLPLITDDGTSWLKRTYKCYNCEITFQTAEVALTETQN